MPLKTFTSGEVLTAGDVNTYLSNVVIQANSVSITTAYTNSTTTLSDVTGLTLSITPKAVTSKILVMVTGVGATSAALVGRINIVRDSTAIGQSTGFVANQSSQVYNSASAIGDAFAVNFLDSPASTSALTYKVQIAPSSAGSFTVGRNTSSNYGAITTLTVMEISQ